MSFEHCTFKTMICLDSIWKLKFVRILVRITIKYKSKLNWHLIENVRCILIACLHRLGSYSHCLAIFLNEWPGFLGVNFIDSSWFVNWDFCNYEYIFCILLSGRMCKRWFDFIICNPKRVTVTGGTRLWFTVLVLLSIYLTDRIGAQTTHG